MMSTYSSDELQAIVDAPMLTGLAVAMVDMGIISAAIEAGALAKQIIGAAEKYPDNALIQAAFSEATLKSKQVNLQKPDIKAEDVQSGAIIDQAIDAINRALQLAEGKAIATDIAEYRQFIYHCATAVAEAAGSGLFGSGSKVSAKEAAALDRFKVALGL
jgi:hypothetical protein